MEKKQRKKLLVGKSLFIRTVTFYYTGRVEKIENGFMILSDAAWIADTGRFYDALKTDTFLEVEPYINNVYVNMASIIDFTEIKTLPMEQK